MSSTVSHLLYAVESREFVLGKLCKYTMRSIWSFELENTEKK